VAVAPTSEQPKALSLSSLFLIFLQAGCLGFGGFMSLIAVVENILVKKKHLLKQEDMLDGITLANLLPGPQAVNVVAYAGTKLRGTWGGIIAAIAVILPSFVLMLLLSYLYSLGQHVQQLQKYFHGFVPAVAAVIASVVWRMAKQTVKGWKEMMLVTISVLVLLSASAGWFGIPKMFQLYFTFLIVLTFGIVGYFLFGMASKAGSPAPEKKVDEVPNASSHHPRSKFPVAKFAVTIIFAIGLVVLGLSHKLFDPHSNATLMTTFSGLSVMLFGGGYVIIPMMQHTVVEIFHWLSKNEFVDCIAFSQVMPGPILIAAAFIGFKVTGFWGAVLSTIAIFTPTAIIMVVFSQALEYFKKSSTAKAIMKGIRCGVIGMIAVSIFIIMTTPPPRGVDWQNIGEIWPTILIFGGALVALIKFNVDVVYIIPVAGLIGYFLYP
jgi:chromate transporter